MAKGSLPPNYADSGMPVRESPNVQQRMVQTHIPLKKSFQGYDAGAVGTGGQTGICSGPGTSKYVPLDDSQQGYED